MASDEIDRFRREIIGRTGDRQLTEKITDADLLREVMNTVGKEGRLGESMRAIGPTYRICGLPSDEHCHHCCLASARCQFQSEAKEFRICVPVRVCQVFDEPFTCLPNLWSDLGRPNRSLHGFNLAEERSEAVEIVVSPVLNCRKPFAFFKNQCVLGRLSLLLFGLGIGGYELSATTSLYNLLRRLPSAIKLPMTCQVDIRRVQKSGYPSLGSIASRILSYNLRDCYIQMVLERIIVSP